MSAMYVGQTVECHVKLCRKIQPIDNKMQLTVCPVSVEESDYENKLWFHLFFLLDKK